MGYKLLFSILFAALFSVGSADAQQFQTHKQLDDSWYYFDKNQRHQSYNLSKTNTEIFLTIDRSQPDSAILQMSVNANTSIFIEDQIIGLVNKDKRISYSIDSLFLAYGIDSEQMTIMLLNVDDAIVKNSKIIKPLFSPLVKTTAYPNSRVDSDFENILLILVLTILVILVYVKAAHSDIWRAYMKWSRILSLKDQGDAIYKLRPFEKGTLTITLVYATLGATCILGLFYLSDFSWPISAYFQSDYVFLFFVKWLVLVLTLYILVFSKYLLVKSFTRLFDFRGASKIHFYNHVRISMVILFFLLAIELIIIFGFQHVMLFAWLRNIVIILLVVKSLIISFKLIKLSTYRMFHLFSYLCATEIIPAIILIKITFLT